MLPLRSERRLSGQCENQRAAAAEADVQHFAQSCRAAALEIVVRAWWHGPSGGSSLKEEPGPVRGAFSATTTGNSEHRPSNSSHPDAASSFSASLPKTSASAAASTSTPSPSPISSPSPSPGLASSSPPPPAESRPRFGRRPRSAAGPAAAATATDTASASSPVPATSHSDQGGRMRTRTTMTTTTTTTTLSPDGEDHEAKSQALMPSLSSRPSTAAGRRPGSAAQARPGLGVGRGARREDLWIRSFARTKAVTKSPQQEVLLMEALFLRGIPRKLASVAASFGETLASDARCASLWPTLKLQESAERPRVDGGFYESEQEQSARLAAKASLFLQQVVSNIFERFSVHCFLGQTPPLVLAPRTRNSEPLGPPKRRGSGSPTADANDASYSDEVLEALKAELLPESAETAGGEGEASEAMAPEATGMTAEASCSTEPSRRKKRGLRDRISDRAEQMFDRWLQNMKDSDDILAKAIASEPVSPEGPLSPTSMATAATAMTTMSTRPAVSPRRSSTTARSSMMAARTTSGARRGSAQRRGSCGKRTSRTRESGLAMPISNSPSPMGMMVPGNSMTAPSPKGGRRNSSPRRGSTGRIGHWATSFL